MRIASTFATLAVAAAVGVAFTACTAVSEESTSSDSPTAAAMVPPSASTSPAPRASESQAVTTDPAYEAAIATYPRQLPDGYAFPSGLIGADSADKWWWCAQIDAAWEAYFNRSDEAAALGYLGTAAAVDPGSYGSFDQPANALPMNRRIDREVRYSDEGVDSQYVEYTAQGCWDWARSVGAEFPPLR